MPTAARARLERRKHKARVWGYVSVAAMGIGTWLIPRSPLAIVFGALVVFVCAIPAALNGYVYKAKWSVFVPIMCAHAALLAFLGYEIWPKITVSPANVYFMGYPGETFNFSIRNGRSDDIYDVEVPFLIGYGKHFDSKFSAKVTPNGDPPHRIYGDYYYCYGKGSDVHKVMPNEQEFLVVNISHMAPYGSGSFSITYAGGEGLNISLGRPTSVSEPKSYSDLQGTFGTRGDYRICRFDFHSDGLVNE